MINLTVRFFSHPNVSLSPGMLEFIFFPFFFRKLNGTSLPKGAQKRYNSGRSRYVQAREPGTGRDISMEKNRILIILALAFALILALSACSKTPSALETDQQKPAASETEKESVKEVEKARETAETEETVEASAPAAEGAGSFELFGGIFTSDAESLKIARVVVWEDYCSEERREKALDELSREALTFGEATMRIKVFIMGEEPVDGYPLYIAMHGGGYSETPDINNIQWEHMFDYYREYVVNGIYVAVRGVRDTWDTHFN